MTYLCGHSKTPLSGLAVKNKSTRKIALLIKFSPVPVYELLFKVLNALVTNHQMIKCCSAVVSLMPQHYCQVYEIPR